MDEPIAHAASAQVLRLPTADSPPVVNPSRRGSYPRGVVSLRVFKRNRDGAAFLAEHAKRAQPGEISSHSAEDTEYVVAKITIAEAALLRSVRAVFIDKAAASVDRGESDA